MKYIAIVLLGFTPFALGAQDVDRFRNFHGIRDNELGVNSLEAEGYEIFIQRIEVGLTDKGIAKIRKKFGAKDARLSVDEATGIKVLTREEVKNGMNVHFVHYLIPVLEDVTRVIGFMRLKDRDLSLEHYFVQTQIADQIPPFVYTSRHVGSSFDFVGRTIELGAACRWMFPHNLQCPNFGQMNWAIFDDLKKAEAHRDTHYEMARNKGMLDVKEEKSVSVLFEGRQVNALRTKIKIKLPKLVMGGSNILVVYYVAAEVRGKFVSCVLSHYTDDVGADKLPPLLSQVMELEDSNSE